MPVTHTRSVVISGDLGSGKSAIAAALSAQLGRRMISVGSLYREMAAQRGMSALQINLHAEHDESIDDQVDQMQATIAAAQDGLVVDSRLGWYFFKTAFKVHLIVDPRVAAARVMSRQEAVEKYSSIDQAVADLSRRSESERLRYLRKYQADKTNLRNYDLICDTTRAALDEAVQHILTAFLGSYPSDPGEHQPPFLLLDPARIYPSASISALRGLGEDDAPFVDAVRAAGVDGMEPLAVAYNGEQFFVVDGHRRLSAALRSQFNLVPAWLIAQRDEPVVAEITADDYLKSELRLSDVNDWGAAHQIALPLPPHLRALAR